MSILPMYRIVGFSEPKRTLRMARGKESLC